MRHIDEQSNNRREENGQPSDGLSQDNPSYSPAEKVRLGRKAMARLRRTWLDWMAIGEALQHGQTEVMRTVSTNQPTGYRYERSMGEWLLANGFKEIDKATRSRLLECLRYRNEIEAWRAHLTDAERFRFNHPNTVIRKWKAASLVTDTNEPPKASPNAKLKESVAFLEEENYCLRRREIERGGGDLWNKDDKPDEIAAVIVAQLSATEAERVARAILKKVHDKNDQTHTGRGHVQIAPEIGGAA